MKSYAEREIFGSYAITIWMDAVTYVSRVGAMWGNELRCHELARAAHRALSAEHAERLRTWKVGLTVVDGRLGPIEHSWITYAPPAPIGQPYRDAPRRAHVLDVYCPGRLPQVQLIDGSSTISREYHAGPAREDIDQAIVDSLVQEMTHDLERKERIKYEWR